MGKQSREKRIRREEGFKEETKINKTGLEKTCLFIIRWGTYLIMFTPLIIDTDFFFPFVAPKTTFFRIIVEILLAAYLFLIISDAKKYRPRINALTIALTLFLAVFILTSFTGINLERSFWSTYERMTGIWTMLHLYAFFVILVSCFKKREDWKKFLGVSVIVGVILSIYILRGDEVSSRGGGTVGNTSFMAAYLLFDVFFALILFLPNFLKKGNQPLFWQVFLGIIFLLPALLISSAIDWSLWKQIILGIILFIPAFFIERFFWKVGGALFWQIFSGISLLIILPVFLASTARGAVASFFLGLSLLFVGYLFFSVKKILKRIALAIILLSFISAILLLVIQPQPVKTEVQTTIRDMKSRFVVWEGGLRGFTERPILGWGPENFNAVFTIYFNPCMSLSECGSEVWFDRVHNIIFDTLVTTGLVGLISYLSIFLVAIYSLFKITAKITEKRDVFLSLGLMVILIAYFFQNLLVFDMINSYLVFFLALAFAGFLIENKEESAESRIVKPFNLICASIIIILLISGLWWGNIKPLIANKYIIKMVGSSQAQEGVLSFQKSLDTAMNKYEAREQYAQKLVKSGNQLSDLSPEEKKVFSATYGLGETEMEKSIKENYLDFRHHLFAAELYLASFRVLGEEEKIIRAEKILEKAIELSPTNQQGYWELAEVYLARGKISETVSLLKKAAELEPRVGKAHWYLALGYKIAGDYNSAKEEALKAQKNERGDWQGSLDMVKQVIDIYRALGDDEGLVDLYSQAIELDPKDAQLWALLAASYANLGQNDKAREAAQKTLEINPDMASVVEEFLKSLPK